jgi:hypothetical protein
LAAKSDIAITFVETFTGEYMGRQQTVPSQFSAAQNRSPHNQFNSDQYAQVCTGHLFPQDLPQQLKGCIVRC